MPNCSEIELRASSVLSELELDMGIRYSILNNLSFLRLWIVPPDLVRL